MNWTSKRTGLLGLMVATLFLLSGCDSDDPVEPEVYDFGINLRWVGSVSTPGLARSVALSGGYAYVADWIMGLQVVDITTSTLPVIIGCVNTGRDVESVAVLGNYAYMTDRAGLQVVEITTPGSPVIVDNLRTEDHNVSVSILGSYVYVADSKGLKVIGITTQASPVTGTEM